MSFFVLIPARYASTRLPGKPLLAIGGRPMIEHVYRSAVHSGAQRVVVATDDGRIAAAVEGFGGEVCLTSPDHRSGTERLAEAAARLALPAEAVVVNVQGDEPMMPPGLIRQVAEVLEADAQADVSTLCTPIDQAADLFDPNVVKVVSDARGRALYFSRAPIPWCRDAFAASTAVLPPNVRHFRHLGIYGYRVGYLPRYVALAACELEQGESLEQLRVLWHGGRIAVAQALERSGPGVDTEHDLARVRALYADSAG